jgi:hypothetical protein
MTCSYKKVLGYLALALIFPGGILLAVYLLGRKVAKKYENPSHSR